MTIRGGGPSSLNLTAVTYLFVLAVTSTPTPFPTPTGPIQAPPADAIQSIGAIVAIGLALLAAVVGYRIIRGGKGL